jgi:hypothetical protein
MLFFPLGGLLALTLAACSSSTTSDGGTTTAGSVTGGTTTASSATAGSTSGSGSGGSTTTSGTGGSSGTGGTSGGQCNGTTTGGSPCNSIANGASVVQEQQSATTAPTPAGNGPPSDGTYFMTSITVYTGSGGASGPDGNSEQQTITFTSSTMTLQQVDARNGCPADTNTGTLAFAGTQVTLTTTCPADCGSNCGGQSGYTWATPNLDVFEAQGNGTTRVRTFTLQ